MLRLLVLRFLRFSHTAPRHLLSSEALMDGSCSDKHILCPSLHCLLCYAHPPLAASPSPFDIVVPLLCPCCALAVPLLCPYCALAVPLLCPAVYKGARKTALFVWLYHVCVAAVQIVAPAMSLFNLLSPSDVLCTCTCAHVL